MASYRSLIFSMSGGEKQSLAFASVYAMNPYIFVLDEPTANLDAGAIDTLRQQIIQIKEEGRTVVIAEHRLYFLMDLIDRAIFIQKGKIVQVFSREEFRNISDDQRIRMGLRSLVHPVLELPPADPPGAQEGLSVENLSCAFDKQPVFSGLGFSAKRGEVLGIVGHNGAGKTTMTRCLCGLLKEVNGTVRLDGQILKAKQRNKASFCVMQDVNHQLFSDKMCIRDRFVPFTLEAAEQGLQIGAAGQESVDGRAQLCFVAGSILFCLVLNVALALVPAGDDDRQAMLLADAVAGVADEVIAPLVGVIVLVVLKTDRIENQVIMDVIPVYVGSENKFILAAQDLPRQLHADPVGFLRRDLPRFKRLDEVAAQVRALVDGVAAGPGKFNVGGLRCAAEGGHQQLSVRLVGIADIVNRGFQR